MDIRRLLVVCDTINSEGGLPAIRPVTRVAACAVIRNPLAGVPRDDLGELVPLGAELGELLVRKALAVLPNAAGELRQGRHRRARRRYRARRRHPPSAHGKADARGDRRRQGDHSLERQGRGRRNRDRRAAVRPRRRLGVRSHRHHHRGRAGRAAAGRDRRGRRARRRRQAAAAHRQGGRAASPRSEFGSQLLRACQARWPRAAPSQMSSMPSNTPSTQTALTGMLAHR